MTKKEKQKIIDYANTLTLEELEREYYDSVMSSLGSQCEDMYEMGYDVHDIQERYKYEKYLCQRSDVLEECCIKRGIALWV